MANWWDGFLGPGGVPYDQSLPVHGPGTSLCPPGTIVGDGAYQASHGAAALFLIDLTGYRRYIPWDVWQHCGYSLSGVWWTDLSTIDGIPQGTDLFLGTWDNAFLTFNPCLPAFGSDLGPLPSYLVQWSIAGGAGSVGGGLGGGGGTGGSGTGGTTTVAIHNGGLYRALGDPHVWYIDGTVRRWVASEAALAACFPGILSTSVPLADPTALGAYPLGDDIIDASTCPGMVTSPPVASGGGTTTTPAPVNTTNLLVGAIAVGALVVGGYELASRA